MMVTDDYFGKLNVYRNEKEYSNNTISSAELDKNMDFPTDGIKYYNFEAESGKIKDLIRRYMKDQLSKSDKKQTNYQNIVFGSLSRDDTDVFEVFTEFIKSFTAFYSPEKSLPVFIAFCINEKKFQHIPTIARIDKDEFIKVMTPEAAYFYICSKEGEARRNFVAQMIYATKELGKTEAALSKEIVFGENLENGYPSFIDGSYMTIMHMFYSITKTKDDKIEAVAAEVDEKWDSRTDIRRMKPSDYLSQT